MELIFLPGIPDLLLREFQLNYYLKSCLPDLYCHFERVDMSNSFFVSRWFMTLFAGFLPFGDVVVIWDCFFVEGWSAIIRIGIALFACVQDKLIGMELDEIAVFMKKFLFSEKFDVKGVLRKAWRIQVSESELKRMEEQFYLDKAKVKLHSIQHRLSYSDRQIDAFRWAKEKKHTLDTETQQSIKAFQEKLKKISSELD